MLMLCAKIIMIILLTVVSDPASSHASLKKDFDDAAIERLIFNFASPSGGIAVADGNIVYTLCQTSNKIHKLKLPTEPPKKVRHHIRLILLANIS